MKYFLDTEFIDDGKTIELISIALVCENGNELYLQNVDCDFKKANDFVGRNVYPKLMHFNMGEQKRSCKSRDWRFNGPARCNDEHCVWRTKKEIVADISAFTNGLEPPEFWAWFADYDWVALCQLHGPMSDLPSHYPHFCHDLVQFWYDKGTPVLPKLEESKRHNALIDARWVKEAYSFLRSI